MKIKKAISESFARETDKDLLIPGVLSSDKGSLGGTILMQPLERLNPSSELKKNLELALSDLKKELGSFFEKIPLIYLIPKSKAVQNSFWLAEEDIGGTNIKPILLISKEDMRDFKSYTYIDLSTGKVIHANTKDAAEKVEKSISRIKSIAAKNINEIIQASEFINDMTKNIAYNDKLESIVQGNVTNLIPSMPMLKKCLKTLDDRIGSLKSRANYQLSKYKQLSDPQRESKEKQIYENVKNKIINQLENPSRINSLEDFMYALFLLYRESHERSKIDSDLNSNKFDAIKKKLSIDDKKIKKIIDTVKKILHALDQEQIDKQEKRKIYNRERVDSSKDPASISGEHPIFQRLPSLGISDFADILPGKFTGHQSYENYAKSYYASSQTEENKIAALENMKKGVLKILEKFEYQLKSKKSLSVCAFSRSDIKELADARNSSQSLVQSYKSGILNKEGKFDKRKIGSVFENTVEDMMTSRYIAIVIRYIEMVFAKADCSKRK